MPGFRVSHSDGLDKFRCRLCGFLFRDPIQAACGHVYCRSCCFESTTDVLCVEDGTVIRENESFRDRFMEREVLCQEVGCTFQDEGCSWRGMTCHLEDHEKKDCKFFAVPCVYDTCNMLVKRGDLADHLKEECIFRQEKCQFCDKFVDDCRMKEHLRLNHNYLHCQMDNLGNVVDDLYRLVDHLQDEHHHLQDEQRHLQDEQRHFQDEQRHLQDEQRRLHEAVQQLQERLHVFKQGSQQQRQDNVKNTLCVMKDNLEDLTRPRDEQGAKVNPPRNCERMIRTIKQAMELRNGDAAQSDLYVTPQGNPSGVGSFPETTGECNGSAQDLAFAQRVASLEKKTADSKMELDTSFRRHDQRIESIEHTLAVTNVTLADLEEYMRQQEISSSDGLLLWTISGFFHKRNDAVNREGAFVVSPCFSTSRYGYKMCARIYLNGDGMGRGTHISVYLTVMRGQYDALLRWPFRQKVTFMLLDQDHVEHVIDAFTPDPNSSSFQRPRRETNIASGCPMFCALSELNNRAYVRDDTMFVKIIVDTDGL